MQYGYIKVAAAIPAVKVADCHFNAEQTEQQIRLANEQGAEIVVFPELGITGYTCQDLFTQQLLIEQAEQAVGSLLENTQTLDTIAVVGVPVAVDSILLNCAVIFQRGLILGIVPKTYLPNYSEFYEKRWFASTHHLNDTSILYAGQQTLLTAQSQIFVTADGVKFGVEICEDVWAPNPPGTYLALAGADIVCNLSASDELIGKHTYLKSLLAQQSARTMAGYVYSGCGFGESTQDVVYGGNALIYENGKLLAQSKRFDFEPQMVISEIDIFKLRAERRTNSTYVNAQHGHTALLHTAQEPLTNKPFNLQRTIDPLPFVPQDEQMHDSCEEIFNIQVSGLAQRLKHIHASKVVLGISGGLDSTLALLVCVRTFDKLGLPREGIIGVTMPGFGTTNRTYRNAINLMRELGITIREISIAKSVTQHFEDIGQDIAVHDVVYENGQARERTQILMDLGNKLGGIVVGTGDLSELALGWATYNGDHMSMYAVNVSIPKTLIKHLVRHVAQTMHNEATCQTLYDIIDTPISPELIPADEAGNIKQKTEDLVGPYELHDFFIYHFLRHGFTPQRLYIMARHAFASPQQRAKHYSDDEIKHWLRVFLRRFFAQQFKRSCLPDGPKVGSVSLSPRGDWRMPSDATVKMWLDECEKL